MAESPPNTSSSTAYRWQVPVGGGDKSQADKHQLKILNSFTRKKETLVTNDKKTIKWYSCGPTVYDVSHLGHARCYITFDIIRRTLVDYFGYQVFYVMNITDIDDKIIKRARSNHLCDLFIANALNQNHQLVDSSSGGGCDALEQINEALKCYQHKHKHETDPAKLEMINKIVETSSDAVKNLEQSIKKNATKEELREIYEKLRDVIADHQDTKLAHTVSDHKIFKELTLKYEREYHEDMQQLNVLLPNALTRVSEYIDEVGDYIKRLESNGFAYRSNGSVYFDTLKFDSDPKHSYAKLVREAFGQKKSLDDGEGELTLELQDNKKSPNDFALWKKSKSGEPEWTTQDYEPGRPGWHIECSVMASHLLGENFDIHSGGCDLKFPHHDNEIAQAEAYYNTGNNWVNYFIHSGHLSISGCKMSKSLKNFITIRQALNDYSSRQLRLAFLAHSWAETLDYSPNTMNTAIGYERTFKEFFLNVTDDFRRRLNKISISNEDASGDSGKKDLCKYFEKWSCHDHQLNQEFLDTVNKIDIALCDNIDTRSTLNLLSALVKECNKRPNTNLILLKDVACYISRMLEIFGASFDEINLKCLFADLFQRNKNTTTSDSSLPSNNNTSNELVLKYIVALAQFRADIRQISKSGEAQQSVRQILALCDTLRDETLPNLGVRLEDKEVEGASYVVKLVDAETIAREKALAKKREEEKRIKEEAAKLEKLKLQKEREEKMKMPPSEMFKSQTDKYSAFDESGLPTHDASGKEVSKSALKKLSRLYAEQEARYNKYVLEMNSNK